MNTRLAIPCACFLALALAGAPAFAGTLVVDADGGADHTQIQDAVDAAAPGDIIKVHAGTYDAVEITTDDLTIQEANANSNPVVDADGGAFGVKIDADGVTIRGLEAKNATGAFNAYGFDVR
ncbi:MAG: hypothetical protein OER88_07635, partial [Planctomycetota bacterium]|nr:hypothetical protein [Planctomycetota bacterium]